MAALLMAVNDCAAQVWLDAGYSRPDAVAWIEVGCTLTEAGEWAAKGFAPSTAAKWMQFFDAAEAKCWLLSGVDNPRIAHYWSTGDIHKFGGDPLLYGMWLVFQETKVYKKIMTFPSRTLNSRRLRMVFPHGVGRAWARQGFSLEEVIQWMSVCLDLDQSVAWRDAGFTPTDALKWSALESSPSETSEYRDEVMSAKAQTREG
jgi:hypothetical protein